jgi:glutathione peroxidase
VSDLLDLPVTSLQGEHVSLGTLTAGKAALVVNVASRCGLTPQYAGLQALHEEFAGEGFTVVGFPCNQFGAQEPGSAGDIEQFCSTTYGVTFPMSDKIEVNGPNRDPIYALLTSVADAGGHAGDIRWNFEKFLISPAGEVVGRYSPQTAPDAAELRTAIESVLAG